jgi:hypothetical protein
MGITIIPARLSCHGLPWRNSLSQQALRRIAASRAARTKAVHTGTSPCLADVKKPLSSRRNDDFIGFCDAQARGLRLAPLYFQT